MAKTGKKKKKRDWLFSYLGFTLLSSRGEALLACCCTKPSSNRRKQTALSCLPRSAKPATKIKTTKTTTTVSDLREFLLLHHSRQNFATEFRTSNSKFSRRKTPKDSQPICISDRCNKRDTNSSPFVFSRALEALERKQAKRLLNTKSSAH